MVFIVKLNPPPPFFLLFLLFFSCILDHGDAHLHSLPPQHIFSGGDIRGIVNIESGIIGALDVIKRRSLIVDELLGEREEENDNTPSLILAQNRTTRKDPTDDFNLYTGGWNISNSHYWTSLAFTAVPLLATAAVWFVLFGLSICVISICYCCCCRRRQKYCGYSRHAYIASLICIIVFTIAAIVGCGILFAGQGKFHGKTSGMLDYVVSQADVTYDNLRNVCNYLSAARNVGVDSFFLPTDLQHKIDEIQTNIYATVNVLDEKTASNAKDIHHFFDIIGWAIVVVAAIMLFLTFLGLLLSIFGLQCLVHTSVVIGWIIVACTFVLCGVVLLVHNVVSDTCVAMDEWVKNPTEYTALDDILPCVDNETAQETLLWTKDISFALVDVIDHVIGSVSNVDHVPEVGPLYFNQSGPLLPFLCNPLNPDFSARECAYGEVDFNNASQVWQNYVCEVSPTGICATPGRLTPIIFSQMTSALNISFGLHHYAPFLVGLVDCTFVRETFTGISSTYCPGLRRYSQWIYIGLVTASAAVMLSVIFWVVYVRERRHRVYTKRLMPGQSDTQI